MSSTPEAADYPRTAADRGRVEPVPRRVRGYVGAELVFDTNAARYVWEVPYYPQYYIPLRDVRPGLLRDDGRPQKVQFGPSRVFSVVAGSRTAESAARVFDDGDGPVAGLVRFEWSALTWFEEDEPIYGHPRNPYARVDALRSHRHVAVELDGVSLADTHSPVMLFETGLPTRYYIDRTDIAFEHLEPSGTQNPVPLQGRDLGLLVGAHRSRSARRPRLDLPDPAARGRRDREHGRLLQREGRHHRRRRADVPAENAFQLGISAAVGDVGVLRMPVDVFGDHPAGRHDAQPLGLRDT